MNPSIAFIGGGREVHGESEYDPFGKTVTERPDGTIHTKWHFIEALNALNQSDAWFISRMAIAHGDGNTLQKSICWESIKEHIETYWQNKQKRIEGN